MGSGRLSDAAKGAKIAASTAEDDATLGEWTFGYVQAQRSRVCYQATTLSSTQTRARGGLVDHKEGARTAVPSVGAAALGRST